MAEDTLKKYGLNLNEKFSAIDVRDTLINCFKEAHEHALAEGIGVGTKIKKKDFSRYQESYVECIIRKEFSDSGGDFDNPDKNSLKKVIGALAKFAINFRTKEVVEGHKKALLTATEKL